MRISVLIPTFRRPGFLAKALRGLAGQTRPADEIILGVREGDDETARFLATEAPAGLALEIASTDRPGVVASMTAAAGKTRGDIVCLLDDDAEPLPDWLERIEARFASEPRLGVLGGRDLLQDHPEMRTSEPTTERVGIFTWYGRIIGAHHRGAGAYRRIDMVKGCNAAVRGPFLREVGFVSSLRGQGAQVHWEVALCLDAQNRGFAVGYDPEIRVIHHIAPRHDDDLIHRGRFSAEGLYDMVWNEHHIIATRAGFLRRSAHFGWAMLVGTTTAPGLAQYVRLCLRGDPDRRAKLAITLRAATAARR